MSKLQSVQEIFSANVPAERRPEQSDPPRRRSRNRIRAASDSGVWTAALAMAFAAFLMPVWFLAAGLALGATGAGSSNLGASPVQVATLVMGGLVFACTAATAWRLGHAPRLAGTHHPTALRWGAIAGLVGVVLLIHCRLTQSGGLAEDGIACATALLPVLLLAEVSMALPAITNNRHGVEAGWIGASAWAAAGMGLLLVASGVLPWWVPLAVSMFAAYWTGLSAARVWQRYEGRMVRA